MFTRLFAVCAASLVLILEVSGTPVNKPWNFDYDFLHDDKECKDLRDDCSDIPAKGEELIEYCKKWKDDKAVQECPMTCGRCKAPSPPAECEDERDDCNWITDNNPGADALFKYCTDNNNEDAVKQCKKTCNFCNAPFPSVECKDERDDCSWITANNPGAYPLFKYCFEYRNDDVIKQCKRTCGLCIG